MPTLEVFQVNLRGPYRHDLMRGISPGQAWMNEELYKVWKLRGTYEIICPHCGKGDCLNHRLSGDEEIFVHRCHENRSKHLYAFQSTALIGQDATEVLIPFAPAVLGRKVSNDVWPSGVLKLTIGDTDATRSTCASSIEARDTVSVYLANPKL
ncbi:MAG: hypothetical protein UU16_C0057G0007 [Candidatus Woesebacteria bacterium GW2011_GWA2_40_7]|uniref:Uncharacterized protein n=1 Tax=Candidatus Woesebacteria bacterium GW2011_GWA2_40_7 TaxID=1618562 RepID=A0A0G0TA28_9BACT|nr:MAG: hypothetical protein UU16_C0057G0007 [Candidatus Woesebacteria bacterium GW2011_GWA2_40_7]